MRRNLTGPYRIIFSLFTWSAIILTVINVFRIRIGGEIMVERAFVALLAGLFLPLAFLVFPASRKAPRDRVPWYDLILAVLAMAGPMFVFLYTDTIMTSIWPMIPPPPAFILGLITWALVIEAIRRNSGPILAAFVGVFAVFPLFGQYLPSFMASKSYSIGRLTGFHFLTDLSIFGIPMQVFGPILLGFMLFGVALEVTGAGKFLLDIAQSAVGRVRGGPALVAVVGSSFMASLSGSSVANVISIGTVTIPAMKKIGYESHVAGAIETCASTGGILTPPVMGATAFIMASLLQVPYAQVAVAAAIPMLIYYISLFLQVYLYAQKRKIPALPAAEIPPFWPTLKRGWFYLGSVAVLVYLLFYIRVEAWAPYYATIFLFACAFLRKDTRPNFGTLYKFGKNTGEILTQLCPQLMGVGMIIGVMALTGIGQAAGGILLALAQGNLYLTLILGAIGALILGTGLTTTPCYIFMVIIFGPALQGFGVPLIAAHFFFLYWGMISEITPPVGFPIYAAAAIAEADPMRVGWHSVRLGLIRFIIPFLFVISPALVANGPVADIVQATAIVVVGTTFMAAGMEGYVFGVGSINFRARLVLIVSGFLVVLPVFWLQVTGGILLALTILLLVVRARRSAASGAALPTTGTGGSSANKPK